ncbi:MAG: hypothetical protein IJ025_02060 [Clostridia bacterium]|nr:hypothetical protein [Clostridia bacterium]
MELTIQEKLKLIEFFEFQRDREVSKPIGEMDVDTIDAYVKILLDLQDKHHQLSSDFINEQVRKVFRTEENKTAAPETVKTTKKRYNKKMVWLIAACIALLVALFSIVSSATEWSFFDFLTEKFGSVHSTPIGERIDFNGETIILAGSSTTYSSVEEALEAEKIDVLYPSVLPESIEIKELLFHQNDSTKTMTYIFNDTALSLEVYFNTSIPEEEKQVSTEIREINSITCYICDMPDISNTQITFEYEGNTYTFSHTEKDALIEIIENLKEIDYEN